MFSFRNIFPAVRVLFGAVSNESALENAVEARWDEEYRRVDRINFAEIFANRLSKYVFAGSHISASDQRINAALDGCMRKSRKWCQTAIGTGRIYLVPYIVGNRIYTDIIPQGRAVVTRNVGDDILGIAVLADIRQYDRKWYFRWTKYELDEQRGVFTVENKATRHGSSDEVPLDVLDEWAEIVPRIEISGVERPLFSYVDSPKDNRTADRLQGAPITFGCEKTIEEIYECFEQYRDEFKLKRTFLGVDKLMLDKDGRPINELYQTFEGKDTESLFEIFSPDLRDASFRGRILDLFARLEREVGTSSGILTPAETSMATATQVRRSMFDTFAMVEDIRDSITRAVKELCYAYSVYLSVSGESFDINYTLSFNWGDELTRESSEIFAQMSAAEQRGVVSKAELRTLIFPNETPEQAQTAIERISNEDKEQESEHMFWNAR